jgi:hypothetical protein
MMDIVSDDADGGASISAQGDGRSGSTGAR